MGTFEQADEEATRAISRPPSEKSWGLYAQPANPEPATEEPGCFLWFDTREELRAFLDQHAVHWACLNTRPEEEDLPRICEAASSLIRQVEASAIPLAEALQELNDWLYEFNMEFAWAGPYTELAGGEGEFPVEVRSWFRRLVAQAPATPDDGRPLREEEALDFMQALEEYGARALEV